MNPFSGERVRIYSHVLAKVVSTNLRTLHICGHLLHDPLLLILQDDTRNIFRSFKVHHDVRGCPASRSNLKLLSLEHFCYVLQGAIVGEGLVQCLL